MDCAQPESNRHTLHGKQEGCHYIMGAKNANRIVKDRKRRSVSEGTGWDSNPHLRIESPLSLPLDQRGVSYFAKCTTVAQSGPGGARILVCGASNRRYTVSATSPFGLGVSPAHAPRKKARCRRDSGPWKCLPKTSPASQTQRIKPKFTRKSCRLTCHPLWRCAILTRIQTRS